MAAFLPWHRYFLTLYEKSLRECGYTGNMMYWNWVADSAHPSQASVFSPTTGFGGNGNQASTQWGTNCVQNGPFSTLQLRYWNEEVRPHCLLRIFEPGYPEYNITEMYGDNYSPAVMAQVNAETTFAGFSNYLENGPHTAVHSGVGNLNGDMGPQSSSPNGKSLGQPHVPTLSKSPNSQVPTRSALLPPPYTSGPALVFLAEAEPHRPDL